MASRRRADIQLRGIATQAADGQGTGAAGERSLASSRKRTAQGGLNWQQLFFWPRCVESVAPAVCCLPSVLSLSGSSHVLSACCRQDRTQASTYLPRWYLGGTWLRTQVHTHIAPCHATAAALTSQRCPIWPRMARYLRACKLALPAWSATYRYRQTASLAAVSCLQLGFLQI